MLGRGDANKRVFFIIKYLLMGSSEMVIFFAAVSLLGSINFWQAFLIGLLNFTGLTLVISRLLERPINRLSRAAVRVLDRFPRIKRIVVRYL